jgi:hypothetical protein
MMHIDWERPPDLPVGTQDSATGVNDTCSPPQKGWGTNAYPNGVSVFDTQSKTFGSVQPQASRLVTSHHT